jgi:hypothetical protein|tara:strand:+ start:430 stop:660 length:231 start_codon:yes stop_codon:yes gene_type:complete
MEKKKITEQIDTQVREMLSEMADRPPRDKEALAGAVEKLLRAKPLASENNLDLFSLLNNLERAPRALEGSSNNKEI